MQTHRPPSRCPVCSQPLVVLRLGCPSCGTELSGHFDTCRFCRLAAADQAILEVFLRSRGNIRDVQAHLGVSYPTARARLIDVLDRLGLADESGPTLAPVPERSAVQDVGAVLGDLAAGTIDVTRAEQLLGEEFNAELTDPRTHRARPTDGGPPGDEGGQASGPVGRRPR